MAPAAGRLLLVTGPAACAAEAATQPPARAQSPATAPRAGAPAAGANEWVGPSPSGPRRLPAAAGAAFAGRLLGRIGGPRRGPETAIPDRPAGPDSEHQPRPQGELRWYANANSALAFVQQKVIFSATMGPLMSSPKTPHVLGLTPARWHWCHRRRRLRRRCRRRRRPPLGRVASSRGCCWESFRTCSCLP